MRSNIGIGFERQLFMFPFFGGVHVLRIGVVDFKKSKKRDVRVALLMFLKM